MGAALAAVLALTNCNKEEMYSPDDYEGNVPFCITADAPQSKTVNDGGFGTDWAAGDGINLFYAEAGETSYLTAGKFSIAEDDLESRTFRGLLASELAENASYDWYVVYPYNAATNAPGKSLVTIGCASDAAQAQTGSGNLAHIAGTCYPVCGAAKAVASAQTPAIEVNHLTSLVEVVVKNASSSPLDVTEIELTAGEAIVGEFYADITKDAPTYTAVSADKVSSTARLTVADAQLAAGASGKYYLAVKPFKAAAGTTITMSVNGIERSAEMTKEMVFSAGLRKTVNFEYALELAPGAVNASKIAFSECDVEWTSDGLAKSFNVYVNGTEFKKGLPAETALCHVTGLKTGVENTIVVEGVDAGGETAQTELKVTTKRVYEYEKSTGTSFLCIGWEAPIRTEVDGKTQAYQIQVFADKDMKEPVYDFVPEPGGNSTQNYIFGNGSFYGKTSKPQGPDGISCANYLTPTRVSVGGFYPGVTYYVRIRTLASFTQNNGKIVSHPWGDSEWSELIPMKTDDVHIPADNEVIYGGFNDMCIQHDFLNSNVGALNANKSTAIAWDNRPDQLFYFYHNNQVSGNDTGYHQASTFGLASAGSRIDGTEVLPTASNCAVHVGYPVGTGNCYIGDMAGWVWAAWTRPAMGAYILHGSGTFVATPALTSNKLSQDGTDCTLTFKASYWTRISDNYSPDTDVLNVQVWRNSTSKYEVLHTFKTSEILPFDVSKDTSSEVLNDYGRNTLKLDLKLYQGDNVEIVSARSNYIILDDILVVTK